MAVVIHWALVGTVGLLLVCAAVSDARKLEIPNGISVGVALAYLPCALVTGLPALEIAQHYGVGLAFLVAGMLVYGLGIMGGGDVKLFAAIAPWLDFSAIGPYLVLVAILGGVVALGVLLLHRWGAVAALRARVTWLAGDAAGRKLPVPYGIAIAAAALWLMPRLHVFPAH